MSRIFYWISELESVPRRYIAVLAVGITLVIGFVDYTVGWQISLLLFYAFPIAMVAWYIGQGPAFALCLAAIALSVVGDLAGGYRPATWLIPAWNSLIRLAMFWALVQTLHRIRSLTNTLEATVQERTAHLRKEISERERLEREMLEVGDRERQQFGYDLHDGLCQHLTGTALTAEVLREKLARHEIPGESEAARVVDLIEEGIALARAVAKGLQPIEKHSGGLMQVLQEFAGTASELFGIACRFECDSPVLVADPAVANHLYHIAREAVANAVKHGRARNVAIALEVSDEGTSLAIRDDGIGMPNPLPTAGGMGLTNMAQRAKLIGASFAITSRPRAGATVRCVIGDTPSSHRADQDAADAPSYV